MCVCFFPTPSLHRECSLVDLYCGTGSIGLSLASHCGQVVGLDVLEASEKKKARKKKYGKWYDDLPPSPLSTKQESVEDARFNALSNGVTNAEFHSGSAEESLPALLSRVIFPQVAVVAEPNRLGLSKAAVAYIRKEPRVRRLCLLLSDVAAAFPCLLDLLQPAAADARSRGHPFVPVRACAVDTFPHTNNFCLALLLLRADVNDLLNPGCLGERGLSADWGPAEKEEAVPPLVESGHLPPPNLTWQPVPPPAAAKTPALDTSVPPPMKNYFARVVEAADGTAAAASAAAAGAAPPPEKDYREALLSKTQREWLDQMSAIYRVDFKRKEWTESMIEQNRKAVEQQQQQQQQQPQQPQTQYYYQQQQQQQSQQQRQVAAPPAESDEAWRRYCQQMADAGYNLGDPASAPAAGGETAAAAAAATAAQSPPLPPYPPPSS